MKVFLTHSYFYQLDPKQWDNKTPYPPLGTISALATLRSKGIDPVFYDVALDSSPESCTKQLEKEQPDVVVIYDDGFNYLTKMCLTNMRNACFEIIESAKRSGAKVIVSSCLLYTSDAADD